MNRDPPLLLFGGTFDPVHVAHIAMAREALSLSGADRLILLPAGDPPHRPPPGAPAEHRARMLALACAGDPRLQVDLRELRRNGPSYSVLSLREFRQEAGPETPLVLVLGADAAAGLGGWKEAGALAGLAHLLVLGRPGVTLDVSLPGTLGWQEAPDFKALGKSPSGRWMQHAGPLMQHSATALRNALNRDSLHLPGALDPAVYAYILQHGLYGAVG